MMAQEAASTEVANSELRRLVALRDCQMRGCQDWGFGAFLRGGHSDVYAPAAGPARISGMDEAGVRLLMWRGAVCGKRWR